MGLKAYEEADIEYYRFLATLDLRTSSICREHDGKIYKVSERKTGVNYPPMHPWCRSNTIADYDKDWLKNAKRRARDPATGKNIIVPGDMTYNEWYKKYVKSCYHVDNLNQQKLDLAQEQYRRYKKLLGAENVSESVENFVELKSNGGEKYRELNKLVNSVETMLKARENVIVIDNAKVPVLSSPNSTIDLYKDGELIQRRYFGKTGKVKFDIDNTDHKQPEHHQKFRIFTVGLGGEITRERKRKNAQKDTRRYL